MKVEDVLREARGTADEAEQLAVMIHFDDLDPLMTADERAMVRRRMLEIAVAAEKRGRRR